MSCREYMQYGSCRSGRHCRYSHNKSNPYKRYKSDSSRGQKPIEIKGDYYIYADPKVDDKDAEKIALRRVLVQEWADKFQVKVKFVDTYEEANVLWVGRSNMLKYKLPKLYLINLLPSHNEITNKKNLMELGERIYGRKACYSNVMPYCFEGRKDINENIRKMKQMNDYYNNTATDKNVFNQGMWICKPAASFGGEGIFIFHESDDTKMRNIQIGSVVQKYIDKPLLLNGFKFDIRAYILISSDGAIRFDHENMYTRTCTTPFELKTSELPGHITATHFKAITKNINIMNELKQYIPHIHSFIHDELSLFLTRHKTVYDTGVQSFHLLGLDMMIDDNGKIWLIEVNANPGPCKSYEQILELLTRSTLYSRSLRSLSSLTNVRWQISEFATKQRKLVFYLSEKMGHGTIELHERRKRLIETSANVNNLSIEFSSSWDYADIIWKGRSDGLDGNMLSKARVFNVLCEHSRITNKGELVYTGNKIYNDKFLDYIHPYTFVINVNNNNNITTDHINECFRKYYNNKSIQIIPQEAMWIIKPTGGFKGNQIMMKQVKDVPEYISKQKNNTKYIIQRYLENPVLLENRKFDVRIYVLVTQEGVFVHPARKLRLCPEKYDIDNHDTKAHLTNVSIHGKSDNTYKDGNDSKEYLDSYSTCVDDLLIQLKPLLLNHSKEWGYHKLSYQMFGLDVMLDIDDISNNNKNYKAWLLEINSNPGCSDMLVWDDLINMQCNAIWNPDSLQKYKI